MDSDGTVEHSLGHRCLCVVKQTAKYKASGYNRLQVVRFLVTAGWRKKTKYLGLQNATLNIVVGESTATQTGFHGPPPYLKK